jgi:hypothetical protein
MLGFEKDFIAYTTLPEAAKDFITDTKLWEQPFENIIAERKKNVEIIGNKTKGLDFFTRNRMIYVFQKNIVKNKRIDLPYFKWFDVANKSRIPNNKEEDFSNYKNDKDMAEVINRIRKDKLPLEEFKYVSDLFMYDIYTAKLKKDHKIEMTTQKKLTKQAVEQERQKNKLLQIKLAKTLLSQEQTIPMIAEALDISIEETKELVKNIQIVK